MASIAVAPNTGSSDRPFRDGDSAATQGKVDEAGTKPDGWHCFPLKVKIRLPLTKLEGPCHPDAGQAPGPRGRGLPWPAVVWEWIRHRAGALAATAVDFGIMIGSVEMLHLGPVVSTAAGALCGAITNFLLGRSWIFRRTDAAARGQAIRYALVSGASLGLNALGEYYLVVRLGVAYVLARVIVATAVGNLWNYPLHKFFVFGKRPGGAS